MRRVSKINNRVYISEWELEDLLDEEDQRARYYADRADDLNDEKALNEV